jgi:glycosyltransferase involved in cell wall biosynthesis
MQNPPLISVITSSFNDVKLLEATIQNISAQTYPNLEYIVIDGGSSDGTKELLMRSTGVVDRWISESDQGIYDAWNKGLTLAKGEYIAFLGAGDCYLPGGLEDLVALALGDIHAEFIFGKVSVEGSSLKRRIIGRPWSWNIFRHYMCSTHVGALHSRKLFDRYGLFNPSYRIAGDYELLLRARANLKTLYSSKVVATMLAGGISQRNHAVLHEAMRAKLEHQAVSRMVAQWDFMVAYTKLIIRSRLLNKL